MIKVLIVDDDPMVAEFNKKYLEGLEGFQLVSIAHSMKEALEIINSHEIDLVLLDVYMPGKSGLEFLSKIRKLGKAVDVILISAARDFGTVQKAMRLGAVDYLIKPFEFERFQAALSSYREKVNFFMGDQPILNQADLDKRLFNQQQQLGTNRLVIPKGLTKNTLKLVWEKIQLIGENAFSSEEIAESVGISGVSMRKYLGFLNDIKLLETEVIYGSVGRPIFKYRLNTHNRHLIKNYL